MRRSLRLSVVEGALHALMVGVSESFLGALAVELGHGPLNLALLATLPPLAGALAQLLAPRLAARFRARERLVFAATTVQALSHLALLAVALTDDGRLWPLLLGKVLYWSSGMIIAPLWAEWMADLTRGVDRARYFSRRAASAQVSLLVGFLAGGALLASDLGEARLRFGALVAAGALLRLGGAVLFLFHAPPRPRPVARVVDDGPRDWGVAIFASGMALAVSVTSPFFTPYMLRELGLGYAAFTGLLAASILSKTVTSLALPRLAARHGVRRLVVSGSLLIAVIPALWGAWDPLGWIFVVQLVGGVGWGIYEFALFQVQITGAPAARRLGYLSVSACLSSGGAVLGALLGSALLRAALPYSTVFFVGAAARSLPALVWITSRRGQATARWIVSRVDSVRPGAGTVGRVVPLDDDPGPER